MPIKIEDIPTEVLQDDRTASMEDIAWCVFAKELGTKTTNKIGRRQLTLDERMDINAKVVEVIEAELERREDGG